MANYNETAVSGSIWTRAKAVQINNPANGTPSITFTEEQVVDYNNTLLSGGQPSFVSVTFNPAAVIPMIDPTTQTATGATMTQGDLYAALYSLYLQVAAARDVQAAANAAAFAAIPAAVPGAITTAPSSTIPAPLTVTIPSPAPAATTTGS